MRVLVVEDEVRLAQALRRGLRAEGFAVDLAHDGEDGLHLAREGDYDAVVLDVMLPGLTGYRVCQALRAAQNWVPVLMLSAKDGEYDEADGLDVGADDYLTKPFSYVVLVARLRALLRRGAPERPAVLAAGDLTPRSRRPGRSPAAVTQIALTPREFALLELLHAPPRRGGAEDRDPRPTSGTPTTTWRRTSSRSTSATCAARSTRRSAARPLQTVRGVGYRLAADGG